jgi:hypothetical protein
MSQYQCSEEHADPSSGQIGMLCPPASFISSKDFDFTLKGTELILIFCIETSGGTVI